jgi:hypothetical protein
VVLMIVFVPQGVNENPTKKQMTITNIRHALAIIEATLLL